jgi:hypothetical protein
MPSQGIFGPEKNELICSDVYDEADGATQTARVALSFYWTSSKKVPDYGGNNAFLINLGSGIAGTERSTVTASTTGDMMMNTYWSQYWYTWRIDVEIFPDQESEGKVKLVHDGPPTSQVNTTVSSSINCSGGIFGDQATGSVGLSSSQSETYPDIGIKNVTDNAAGKLHHVYYPEALEEKPYSDFALTIKDAPAQCYSNIPIISQGLWVWEPDLLGSTIFTVRVRQILMAAHANAALLTSKIGFHEQVAIIEVDRQTMEAIILEQ